MKTIYARQFTRKIASGGPAGGQTFEKFDKQVFKNDGHYLLLDFASANSATLIPTLRVAMLFQQLK